MINIIQNTIGALGRVLGIVRKNLQLWLDFTKSEVIGSEELVNGDFATDSDWAKSPSGVTISGGSANFNLEGDTYVHQDSLTVGKTYELKFSGVINSGSIYIGELGVQTINYSSGEYLNETAYFTVISSPRFIVRRYSSGTLDATISNISVKEVTQFVIDRSPNTNNAKLFTGKALSFGGNDYVDCGDVGANKTLAFWFNPTTDITSITPYQRLFGFNTTYHGITLGAATGSLEGETLTVLPDATGGSRTATTMDFDAGVWYRVVVVWNTTSSYYDIYVNGDLKTDLVSGTANETSWDSFFIGKDNATSQTKFNGYMSDVQIYSVALSEPDITFDYNNPNHLAIDNPDTDLVVTDLKAYWALSEGDGLVAYDSGSTLEEDVVQNGDFSELGVEEVTNGDFATDSDWSLENGAVINSGSVNIIGVGSRFRQDTLIVTESYKLTYEVITTNGEAFRFQDGLTAFTDINQNIGIHTYYFTATGDRVQFQAVGDIDARISNISVKQVDPNDEWVIPSGWGVSDSSIVSSSGNGSLTQDIGVVSDKTYLISINILTFTSGTLYIDLGGSSAQTYTTDGVKSFNLTTTSTGLLRFYGGAFLGSITNITVTEITPSDHGGLVIGATYVDKQPTIPQLGMMDWAKGSNLITYSEDFSATDWVKTNASITTNTTTSPITSSLTADTFEKTSAVDTVCEVYQTPYQNTGNHTLSIYIKTIDATSVLLRLDAVGNSCNSAFTFSTKTFSNTGANFVSASYLELSNGWFKLSLVGNITSIAFNSAITMYSNALGESMYLWGAQVEESSSAGNYILTDGAAAIDVTTIQNPTNKGYDILGNALRLRENAFNLDGSGLFKLSSLDNITTITNGSLAFWLKTTDTKGILLKGQDNSHYLGAWTKHNDDWFDSPNGTGINPSAYTIYKDKLLSPLISTDGDWHYYVMNGADFSNFTSVDFASYSGYEIDGLLDEVLIYDRPLTSKEITNNYKFGLRTHS